MKEVVERFGVVDPRLKCLDKGRGEMSVGLAAVAVEGRRKQTSAVRTGVSQRLMSSPERNRSRGQQKHSTETNVLATDCGAVGRRKDNCSDRVSNDNDCVDG